MSEEANWLTPSEMAARTGITIDTLRYYEREGLIARVTRAPSGHRRYSEADVGWVRVLRCLRLTDMPIAQMKAFAALGAAGEHTEAEHHAQLLSHRKRVVASIRELEDALVVLDEKTSAYEAALLARGAR